ncbi:c-type cytochrome [Aquimarina algiphila]|uniref:C-type cytochrome n=1 Tax=Aquimarina algiphila TaxID=2047982 RepID=A0A554VG48_9FLAO|nr:c-type cytochrome [Aquimarina algiphila]TSE06338.1 c-type cytochrome [Aquimarina algiphila]
MNYIYKIGVLFGIVLLFSTSCQSEKKDKEEIKIGTKKEKISSFDLGKSVFNGKGKCYTCHKIDKKSIGPGVIDIIKIYEEQNGDLIAFLKQEAEPIVDPETYAVMKTNFAIIKTFTEEELKAVTVYMNEMGKGKTE